MINKAMAPPLTQKIEYYTTWGNWCRGMGCMSRLPNPSTAVEPVMKCNRKGCETQWVSTELDWNGFAQLGKSGGKGSTLSKGRAGSRPFLLALTLTLRAGPPSAWPWPRVGLTLALKGWARAGSGPTLTPWYLVVSWIFFFFFKCCNFDILVDFYVFVK